MLPNDNPAPIPDDPSVFVSGRAWFGLLGGAIAWTTQLLAAYVVAEFGCASWFSQVSFVGFSGVACLIALISLVMLALSIAASRISYRVRRQLNMQYEGVESSKRATYGFIVNSGVVASNLFSLIIAAQTLPLVFYLRSC